MQHFITIFCWDYLERIFPERLGKDHLSLKDGEEWPDGDLTDILGYSATVFISGTRFLHLSYGSAQDRGALQIWIKETFILERGLGALFSVLFFIAISGTIVRAS